MPNVQAATRRSCELLNGRAKPGHGLFDRNTRQAVDEVGNPPAFAPSPPFEKAIRQKQPRRKSAEKKTKYRGLHEEHLILASV